MALWMLRPSLLTSRCGLVLLLFLYIFLCNLHMGPCGSHNYLLMKPAFYIARGPNLTPFCKLEVKDLWCCNWGCFKLDEMMKDVNWTYSFSFYTACWAMWAFMLQKFLRIKFVQKVSIFKVLVLKVCIKFLYIKCLYRKFRCIELLILKVLYKSFLCMMFLRTHLYI